VPSSVTLYYWVEAVDKQGVSSDPVGTERPTTGVVLASSERRPARYALDQNFPNPFNGETTIAYQQTEPGSVTLAIYTVTGQRVRILVEEDQSAGRHHAHWNGLNDAGQSVASGVYVCRIRAGSFSAARTMMLVR